VSLRRFANPRAADRAPEPAPAPAPAAAGDPEAGPCELCGNPSGPRHGHVVDIENRSILCACRACYLLFTGPTGRFRAVPERTLHDPERPLTRAEWDGLGIPVASAFFLRGDDGVVSAFYPSPAGATECLLDLAAWATLCETHPLLSAAAPAVEAVLIRADTEAVEHVEHYLVPIDRCYELVGLVRVHWQGFDGGTEARTRIDAFFATLRTTARVRDV